jgi:starch-binding outer membrane protein, SusD/RagB family
MNCKNIKMKKIIYLVLLLGTIGFSACNFLEVNSPNGVAENDVISTADGIRSARIGMYATLTDKNYYGGTFPLALEAHSDNGANGGYAVAAYNELGTDKAVTPNNIVIEKIWLSIYSTANVSNQILANIDNVKNLGDDANKIKGEAYFVRALCHFDLLKVWGEHWDINSTYGIPVVTAPQSFDRIVARNSVQETYTAIIDDLLKAKELLITGNTKSFATPTAVNALLAKVYLFSKDNIKASEAAIHVIDSSGLKLYAAADYGKIFNTKESGESIFELAFTTQSRSSFNQLCYVRPEALRTEVIFLLNADLDKFFKARTGDVRANLVNFKDNDPSISPDGRSEKYRGEQTKDNPAYVLRLAEQYLIAAETSGKVKGLAYLNTIRTKRGMKALLPAISDADYGKAIADERRAELNNEGHRYTDLARTGQVQTVMGKDVKSNLPIPSREITATNGVLIQNQGY